VPVSDDGHFRIPVTGRQMICHLRATTTTGSPLGATSGCDLVDLPVSAALTASYGEGGFHAEVEDSFAPTG
jgi:hypothetical protein